MSASFQMRTTHVRTFWKCFTWRSQNFQHFKFTRSLDSATCCDLHACLRYKYTLDFAWDIHEHKTVIMYYCWSASYSLYVCACVICVRVCKVGNTSTLTALSSIYININWVAGLHALGNRPVDDLLGLLGQVYCSNRSPTVKAFLMQRLQRHKQWGGQKRLSVAWDVQ